MAHRKEKLPEIIREVAGKFVAEESNRTSLITITNVLLSKDGKGARVLFTVFPEDKEKEALKFMSRKTRDFKAYLKDHSRIGMLPKITFDIDAGEKNRQRIDFLSGND